MSTQILELLPSIHATLIGIFFAFFISLYIYVSQKIWEAQKSLEIAVNKSKNFSIGMAYIGANDYVGLINGDGELVWDGKVRKVLHTAGHIMETSSGDSTAIEQAAENLLFVTSNYFTTYPFNGQTLVSIPGTTEIIDDKKNQPFDKQRLGKLKGSLEEMLTHKGHAANTYRELVQAYDSITYNKEKQKVDDSYRKSVELQPASYTDEQKEEFKKNTYRWLEHWGTPPNYMIDFFDNISTYQREILPSIERNIEDIEYYKRKFKLDSIKKPIATTIGYILLMGVLLPLSLLVFLDGSSKHVFGSPWFTALEFLLLVSTTVSYGFLLYFCKSIVK
ncbi:hypothetical protein AB4122_12755 [Vibrio cyclitrophicus]